MDTIFSRDVSKVQMDSSIATPDPEVSGRDKGKSFFNCLGFKPEAIEKGLERRRENDPETSGLKHPSDSLQIFVICTMQLFNFTALKHQSKCFQSDTP